MASYRTLFTLGYDEIAQRAREKQIKGRGSMSKVEMIVALAEEDLSGLAEVLDQRKEELVQVANDMDLETNGTKDDLQIRIADAQMPALSDGGYPDSSRDGSTRKPAAALESSFETTEQRREEIMKGAGKAIATGLKKGVSYLLLESLLPRDAREPLSIQPAYVEHHPDEVLVLEVIVPQERGRDAGPATSDERVITRAQEAGRVALKDGVSQVVCAGPDGGLTVRPSHRQRERERVLLTEIVVPHIAHRVHKAEHDPLRLWKSDGHQ